MKNVIVPIQNMSLIRRVLLELKEKFIKNTNKHMANLDIICELEVRDKDGKIVSYRKFKSKSFVAFFLSWLHNKLIFQTNYFFIGGVIGEGFVDVYTHHSVTELAINLGGFSLSLADVNTGATYTATLGGYAFRPLAIGAQANDDSYGIVIGTGTTPQSATDTGLQSQLPNSSMQHSAMQFDNSINFVSGTQVTYKFSRSFTNNTPNTINVSEAGIYAHMYCHDGTTDTLVDATVMIARDVFSAQPVASGQVLVVRYTISITS